MKLVFPKTGTLHATLKTTDAVKSLVKTRVLRMDRASPEVFAGRLKVCENCPGGHAVKKTGGSLHTCGPMLESLHRAGKGTCGCVLREKARDIKEDCPFGYWPKVSLPVLTKTT